MNIKESCRVADVWVAWACPVTFLDDCGTCEPPKRAGRA